MSIAIKRLFLFRHGETDWNLLDIYQGSTDIPLNATGLAQAEALARALDGEGIEHVFASDLARASVTAETVARRFGAGVTGHRELRETSFGQVEGRKRPEAKREYADIFARLDDPANPHFYEVRLPGGESRAEVIDRVRRLLRDAVAPSPYRTVGLATHGHVMQSLYAMLTGTNRRFGNCEFFQCAYDTRTHGLSLAGETETARAAAAS